MELLDLDDDAIIALFKFCDKESKLNLMATCKRFEFLIGNNLELYKEFKLKLDGSKLEDPEALLKIRRLFGEVWYNVIELLSVKEFEVVLRVFQIIGEKVVDLKLEYANLSVDSVVQILKRVPNISSLNLIMSPIRFVEENQTTSPPNLPNLKSLELDSSIDHSFFNQLFSSVISLHHFKMDSNDSEEGNEDHWKIVQQIIANNQQLKSLSLSYFKNIKIFDFPAETEIQLEKLKFVNFKIAEKSAVDKFTRFIKIQKNVKELYIGTLRNDYCYKEVLTHLLNLKSLEKLFIQFNENVPILDIMKLKNPNLKTLEVNGNVEDRLFSFFPNIQTLIFCVFNHSIRDEFYVSVNSLEYLKEVFMHNANDGKIQHICLKNLEKFEIGNFEYSDDNESVAAWNQFTKNNSGIKHLMLGRWSGEGNFLRHLECIMENFPNLKSLNLNLDFGSEEIENQAIEIIVKNFANLEYVELRLNKEVAKKAGALFREKSLMIKFKFNEHYSFEDDLFSIDSFSE